MSTALLKALLYGKDFSLHGPADFFHLCESWKADIRPESFNPLIPITRGVSFQLLNGDDRSGQALMFGNDWLNRCLDAGADTKNAVICLASNFDTEMGLVALSLELAMVALKPGTPDSLRIDAETYLEIIEEVFVKDYAGVQAMSEQWGIGINEDDAISPKKTRSDWRAELGHDVLIHPVTLEPCRDEDGTLLEYGGTSHDSGSDKCSFRFKHRATGREFQSLVFLPV